MMNARDPAAPKCARTVRKHRPTKKSHTHTHTNVAHIPLHTYINAYNGCGCVLSKRALRQSTVYILIMLSCSFRCFVCVRAARALSVLERAHFERRSLFFYFIFSDTYETTMNFVIACLVRSPHKQTKKTKRTCKRVLCSLIDF